MNHSENMSGRGSEGSALSDDLESMLALLSEGKISDARELSDSILERSRSASERNHAIEARVRIERALIGAVPDEMIGRSSSVPISEVPARLLSGLFSKRSMSV